MYDAELSFAKELAYKAGEMMRDYSSSTITIEIKDDESPVTAADKAINDLVISEVNRAYPGHGVLGEEASNFNNEEYVWVCDPIDGTVAFINHVPTSVFAIALVKNGAPVVAAVYNPWTDELFYATKGGGTFCNGNKIHVSDHQIKGATLAVTGSIHTHSIHQIENLTDKLGDQTFVISFISSIFKGCLIAGGFVDGYIFRHHTAHDVAPSKLLVEEAGGMVTDMEGNEQRYDRPINGAVISNGVIHNELLELV